MLKTVQKIEISPSIIWKTILILLAISFLYYIKDVLLLLFLAIIIVSAAGPIIDKMESKKIPRILAVVLLYFSSILLFVLVLSIVVPVLSNETQMITKALPEYFTGINNFIENVTDLAASYHFEENFNDFLANFSNGLTNSLSSIFSNTLGFLVGVFKALVIFSLAFYMLIKKDGTRAFVNAIVHNKKHKKRVIDLVEKIQTKMGRWLVGQFSLMFIIFVLEFIALSILGVPFALILALIGGLLEIVPYIGPLAAFVPAVLIASTVSPWTALFVAISYILIQQIENHLIVPLVMKKAVGLNPVVIILSLLIGGRLAGVPGIILAVPFVTAMEILLEDFLNKKEE